MLRLAPKGVLESCRDIANATLQGDCTPGSWKREVMFPIEKFEGTGKMKKTPAHHAH